MINNEAWKDLLKSRSIFTGMFFLTTCYLFWNSKPIPILLERIDLGLLGVWFGEKIYGYAKNGGTK